METGVSMAPYSLSKPEPTSTSIPIPVISPFPYCLFLITFSIFHLTFTLLSKWSAIVSTLSRHAIHARRFITQLTTHACIQSYSIYRAAVSARTRRTWIPSRPGQANRTRVSDTVLRKYGRSWPEITACIAGN